MARAAAGSGAPRGIAQRSRSARRSHAVLALYAGGAALVARHHGPARAPRRGLRRRLPPPAPRLALPAARRAGRAGPRRVPARGRTTRALTLRLRRPAARLGPGRGGRHRPGLHGRHRRLRALLPAAPPRPPLARALHGHVGLRALPRHRGPPGLRRRRPDGGQRGAPPVRGRTRLRPRHGLRAARRRSAAQRLPRAVEQRFHLTPVEHGAFKAFEVTR